MKQAHISRIMLLFILFLLFMGAKLQKNTHSVNFFAKKFAGFKKTPYLCTRKSEMMRTCFSSSVG
jgi:hypothetical protein